MPAIKHEGALNSAREVTRRGAESTELNIRIGRMIRHHRLRHDMTMLELAKVAGVTYQQMHKYEMGHDGCSLARGALILDALGLTSGDLIEAVVKGTVRGEPGRVQAARPPRKRARGTR